MAASPNGWSGPLPAPYDSGSAHLGRLLNPGLPEDALASTFQGELIAGFLNDDGALDVLSYADALRIVPGNGSGGFENYYDIEPYFPATDAAVIDINGNGRQEIIAVSGPELRIYERTPQTSIQIGDIPQGVVTTIGGEQYTDGLANPNIAEPPSRTYAAPRRLRESFLWEIPARTGFGGAMQRERGANSRTRPACPYWPIIPWACSSTAAGCFIAIQRATRFFAIDLSSGAQSVFAGTGQSGHAGDGGASG